MSPAGDVFAVNVELLAISLPAVFKSQNPFPDKIQIVLFAALDPLPAHSNSTPDFPFVVFTLYQILETFFVASSDIPFNAEASILVTRVSPVPSLMFVIFTTLFTPEVSDIV